MTIQTNWLVDSKENFKKPLVPDFGRDGNAFALMAQVSTALKRAGHVDVAKEFTSRALSSHSYEEVLNLCADYGDLQIHEEDEQDDWNDEDEEEDNDM